MALLETQDFGVSARLGGIEVDVLRDLTFTLGPGKVLSLVGESGAGKSMIGRAIARDLPAGFAVSTGRLAFEGRDLASLPARDLAALLGREIAFIPQEPLSALNPVLTVGRQFDEHLRRIEPAPRAERRARAVAALESVRLPRPDELLARYPHQLSGGMCQRVLIAMAFASRPKLIVADEPTTALDVTVQAEIVRLLRALQDREGTGVLFITHDLRLAADVGDEVLVLYAGRPAERGPARLLRAPAHPYTRCLELAAPAIDGERRGLYALPERMPGLMTLGDLPGCRFAPRCPNAVAACREAPPPFVEVAPGQVAACLRPEMTAGIPAPPPEAAPPVAAACAPLLEVRDLGKVFTSRRGLFGRFRSLVAVREARLRLADGEFVGVVGESGSGKSTLARLIVGLERPSAGTIVLAGEDVTVDDRRSRAIRRSLVQMVFQDPQSALNPRRRVGSLVTQALEARTPAIPPQERLARAEALLAAVGLPPDAARRYPAQLSGGQKQRVNIARALAAEPRILVADEIVSGLDVSVQAQIMDLLARLRRERGFSMLFISHDLSVVRHLCDRVIVMYRGDIVESGPTERVFRDPAHAYTRTLLAAVPR